MSGYEVQVPLICGHKKSQCRNTGILCLKINLPTNILYYFSFAFFFLLPQSNSGYLFTIYRTHSAFVRLSGCSPRKNIVSPPNDFRYLALLIDFATFIYFCFNYLIYKMILSLLSARVYRFVYRYATYYPTPAFYHYVYHEDGYGTRIYFLTLSLLLVSATRTRTLLLISSTLYLVIQPTIVYFIITI